MKTFTSMFFITVSLISFGQSGSYTSYFSEPLTQDEVRTLLIGKIWVLGKGSRGDFAVEYSENEVVPHILGTEYPPSKYVLTHSSCEYDPTRIGQSSSEICKFIIDENGNCYEIEFLSETRFRTLRTLDVDGFVAEWNYYNMKEGGSTEVEALETMRGLNVTQSSKFTKVSNNEFKYKLTNLIANSSGTNQGDGTMFSWAASLTRVLYEDDPKGMVDAMVDLYKTGVFNYENGDDDVIMGPGSDIRNAVGSDAFNAVGYSFFNNNHHPIRGRSIQEVDQMLYMSLAGKYKGYTNQNLTYSTGDEENPFWSFASFTKTAQAFRDFGYEIRVTGSDTGTGWSGSKLAGVRTALEGGNEIVLLLNAGLFKGCEPSLINGNTVGTHYMHIHSIEQAGKIYRIEYWDYGTRKTKIMKEDQFNNSVYGMIEVIYKKLNTTP